MTEAPHSYPVSDYADLVKELHQASDDYDRGHGPLHAAAANAIEHLSTLLTSHYTCRKAPECPHCGKIGNHDGACGAW